MTISFANELIGPAAEKVEIVIVDRPTVLHHGRLPQLARLSLCRSREFELGLATLRLRLVARERGDAHKVDSKELRQLVVAASTA